MIHDKEILLTMFDNRKSKTGKRVKIWWSELAARCNSPVRGAEPHAEYMSWNKTQQDEAKDCGAYIGGTLKGNVRSQTNLEMRSFIALDIDNAPADLPRQIGALGAAFILYSTRKHTPYAPRMRALFLTDRDMTPDEYEPVSRKLAQLIDPSMKMFDSTTFEISRMMFWSSCSADQEFICLCEDKPFLSVDGMLNLYTQVGQNWQDFTVWPQVPGEQKSIRAQWQDKKIPQQKTALSGHSAEPTTYFPLWKSFCLGFMNLWTI